MPTAAQYDPTSPEPYQPTQLPESATAPPPEVKVEPPQQQAPLGYGKGKSGAIGGIASIGDSILRGYMKGKAQAEQIKALRVKKQADAAQFSYNNDAEKYLGLVQAYGDPKKLLAEKKQLEGATQAGGAPTGEAGVVGAVPNEDSAKKTARLDEINGQLKELDKARGAVDASWASWMKIYGDQINPPGKGGKGKKKGGQGQDVNPLQQAMSKDPQEKMQGIYGTLLKMGPPVYMQAAKLDTPQAQADKKYAGQNADNQAQKVTLQSELAQLEQTDTSTMDPAARAQHANKIEQKKNAIAALGPQTPGATGTKYYSPRYGPAVTGADLKKLYPNGVPGPNGTFVPSDGDALREVIYGEENGKPLVRYEPMTVSDQAKTVADSSGQPIITAFNPLQHKMEGGELAKVPQKAQYMKIDYTDAKGNPQSSVVALMPQYKHHYFVPPAGMKLSKPVDLGSEGDITRGAQVVDQAGQPIAAAGQSGATPGAAKHAGPTPEQHKAKTPEDHSKQADKVAKEAGVPPGAIFTVDKYSKSNQDAGKAIAAQELTINGFPGSKTDIGLRAATMNVLKKKDDLAAIATAMNALDTLAKSTSSGHEEGDYGWIPYFKTEWSKIPAVEHAQAQLSDAGRSYLTMFFRAWTNVATIRSLQGSAGKPQQAMYAMLSNELPILGVNTMDETQATEKINALQHDVDLAKERLPKNMRDDLQKEFGQHKEETVQQAAPAVKGYTPEEEKTKLDEFMKKHSLTGSKE